MDKDYLIIAGICVVFLILGYSFFHFYAIPFYKRHIEMKKECESLGIEEYCIIGRMECIKDCEKLQYNYFKYDGGGFGNPECWCVEGNKSIQVW